MRWEIIIAASKNGSRKYPYHCLFMALKHARLTYSRYLQKCFRKRQRSSFYFALKSARGRKLNERWKIRIISNVSKSSSITTTSNNVILSLIKWKFGSICSSKKKSSRWYWKWIKKSKQRNGYHNQSIPSWCYTWQKISWTTKTKRSFPPQ